MAKVTLQFVLNVCGASIVCVCYKGGGSAFSLAGASSYILTVCVGFVRFITCGCEFVLLVVVIYREQRPKQSQCE